ncbi:uracil-DNA glycosylase [bacterium]|nr:uracil-DNA glycosylase [bacterium]
MTIHKEIFETLNECESYFKQLAETEKNSKILIEIPKKTEPEKIQTTQTLLRGEQNILTEKSSGSENVASLQGFYEQIYECTKCSLCQTRTNFVFGSGNPNAKLMLIGEAPGADEDLQGKPFVGRSGQLLDKILAAIQIQREEVFIANILKCRPPNNRDPLPSEVEKCEPYLKKQIDLINPKIILALGRIAGQTLLKTNETLSGLRGKVHTYHGKALMVTFHPAALLRNPNWKRPTWEDVQELKKLYDKLLKT